MPVALDQLEVNAATLARVLGVTPQHVSGMTAKGLLVKAPSGKYPLLETNHAFIRWLREENKRNTKTAAAQRVAIARATEIEQRTKERARELIPMDEAKALIIDVVGGLRAELDGAPAGITRDLVLRKKIEKTLNGILTRSADRLKKQADALESGSEFDASAASDDAG